MAKLHFHLESKAIRSALYFVATVINRNALINRDASATTKSNARAERNKTASSRRINHFNSCCRISGNG